jgi:lantibiotic modifying enzyme
MALAQAGEDIPADLVSWLSAAAHSPGGCAGSGLYDGLHGVAYTLELLGSRDAALEVLGQAPLPDAAGSWGLFGGGSGTVMNTLHFAQIAADDRLHAAALTAGQQIRERILAGEVPDARRAGLFHGLTGPALMCLHLFDETGQSSYLDAAQRALRVDLSAGEFLPDGTFHVRAGSRRLVYLDGGSTGIALVLSRFLQRREDVEFSEVLDAVHRACEIPFVLQPGLFQGRAGLVMALSEAASLDHRKRETLLRQSVRMGWYAIQDDDCIVFPGSGLTRLSMDLATGSAGILLALLAAEEPRPVSLPYL